MLLTVTVMLNTSCEEGNVENNATTLLESEGNSMKTTTTALEISQYPDEMKSGISADIYKTRVVPKTPRFGGRNAIGAAAGMLVTYIMLENSKETGKKERKR